MCLRQGWKRTSLGRICDGKDRNDAVSSGVAVQNLITQNSFLGPIDTPFRSFHLSESATSVSPSIRWITSRKTSGASVCGTIADPIAPSMHASSSHEGKTCSRMMNSMILSRTGAQAFQTVQKSETLEIMDNGLYEGRVQSGSPG